MEDDGRVQIATRLISSLCLTVLGTLVNRSGQSRAILGVHEYVTKLSVVLRNIIYGLFSQLEYKISPMDT